LRQRVRALADSHATLWTGTEPELVLLGEASGYRSRFAAGRAATRLVDALASEVVALPAGQEERALWQDSVRERLQELGQVHLGWPDGYRRLLFGNAYFEASRAFAREARRFDPGMPLEDLWQSLRNVWIGNSLQMLLELPVGVGPGLFAYSMLYPVSDNLLDDPTVAPEEKSAFNARFGRRLAGVPVSAAAARERAAFRLVERIEEEFPRHRFPDVFESLLAIHAGQVRSLDQHGERPLGEAELLAASCEKGGSSVLADLYLVAGSASPAEESFAFGYGVFLQLLDDLQDVESDLAAGHQTLFTSAARSGPLDAITARLSGFVNRVLDAGSAFAGPGFAERRDLIRRNCLTLLVSAVAERPGRFTWSFRRRMESRWPLSLAALRRLRKRLQSRLGSAALGLQRRTGAASLLDWALAQPP
jgi:hypothetical protein